MENAHAGLFTFASSPKHVGLYQKFGFWPRFLTAILSKPVASPGSTPGWTQLSSAPAGEHEAILRECRALTDGIFPGLDVRREIRAVAARTLGDTVLVWDGSRLAGVAVCHFGAGTEAGSATCYMKFGAARTGPNAEEHFGRLLAACEEMASQRGLSRLTGGSAWPGTKRTGRCWRTGSGRIFRVWRCIGPTSRATAGPAST